MVNTDKYRPIIVLFYHDAQRNASNYRILYNHSINFVLLLSRGKHIIAMCEMFFVYKHSAANTNHEPSPQKNGILKGGNPFSGVPAPLLSSNTLD